MALFKMDAGFKITGRGFVIAGDIMEGTIKVGDKLIAPEFEQLHGRALIGCEFIDNIGKGTFKIGLMIACQTQEELSEFESLKLQNKLIKTQSPKPNLLVVCGRNKRRSRTAEYIFKNDMRFHIRSVGLSPKSNRQITERDVAWADLILVMERPQKTRITEMYLHQELPRIEVLHIADEYDYLDSALIELLTDKINSTLKMTYDR